MSGKTSLKRWHFSKGLKKMGNMPYRYLEDKCSRQREQKCKGPEVEYIWPRECQRPVWLEQSVCVHMGKGVLKSSG